MNNNTISPDQIKGTLHELTENFKKYLDIAALMFVILDTKEVVRMINKKGCEILGYSEDEIIGKNWFDGFLPPDIGSEVKMVYNQMMHSGRPGEYYENPIIRKDGEERIIYWHSSMLYDDEGKIVGVLSSGEDTTEFHKTQIKLQEHSRTMEGLYALSQGISESTDLADLFSRIGSVLSKNLSLVAGCFFLPNEVNNILHRKGVFGNNKYISMLPEAMDKRDEYFKKILELKKGYVDEAGLNGNNKKNHFHRYSICLQAGKEIIGILSVILKDTEKQTLDFFRFTALEAARGITRKKSELALKESEEKFYTVFQTSPDPIAIAKIEDGTYLAVNEKFTEITGFTSDEVIGKNVREVRTWKNSEDREHLVKELREKGKVSNFELVLRKKNGTYFNGLMSAKIIEYNGRTCMLSMVKDISERIKTEREILEAKEKLEKITSTSPAFISLYDIKNDRTIYSNKSLLKSVGYDDEDVKRISAIPSDVRLFVYHPDDIKVVQESDRRVLELKDDEVYTLEFRLKSKDGSFQWFRHSTAVFQRDENGIPIQSVNVFENITESKKAFDTIERRNTEINLLFEAGQYLAGTLDLYELYDRMYDTISQALDCSELFVATYDSEKQLIKHYYIRSRLLNKRIDTSHIPPIPLAPPGYGVLSQCIRTGESKIINDYQESFKKVQTSYTFDEQGNLQERLSESSRAYEQNSCLMVPIKLDSKVFGVVQIFSDKKNAYNTEQLKFFESLIYQVALANKNVLLYQKAQEEIKERQKAEAELLKSLKDKELLLREIHHRVKNNLAVVSSLLYLQSKKTQNPEVLDALLESQQRIKSMVLVHERLYRSKDFSSIKYSEYIEALTKTLFNSYGYDNIRVALEMDIKDIYLDTDSATNVGLIINELISNSIKHAFPDGKEGKISISFDVDDKGLYTLLVKDNGVGLPPDFDYEGSDTLGIKLVSTLVEQIEGTMEVDKTCGTSFKIKFKKRNG